MLLNDVGPLLTAIQFQLSLYDSCHLVYITGLFIHEVYGIYIVYQGPISFIWS